MTLCSLNGRTAAALTLLAIFTASCGAKVSANKTGQFDMKNTMSCAKGFDPVSLNSFSDGTPTTFAQVPFGKLQATAIEVFFQDPTAPKGGVPANVHATGSLDTKSETYVFSPHCATNFSNLVGLNDKAEIPTTVVVGKATLQYKTHSFAFQQKGTNLAYSVGKETAFASGKPENVLQSRRIMLISFPAGNYQLRTESTLKGVTRRIAINYSFSK